MNSVASWRQRSLLHKLNYCLVLFVHVCLLSQIGLLLNWSAPNMCDKQLWKGSWYMKRTPLFNTTRVEEEYMNGIGDFSDAHFVNFYAFLNLMFIYWRHGHESFLSLIVRILCWIPVEVLNSGAVLRLWSCEMWCRVVWYVTNVSEVYVY
jgi:hypothetical protein